jgi:hypothetical protein
MSEVFHSRWKAAGCWLWQSGSAEIESRQTSLYEVQRAPSAGKGG